MKEPLYTCPSCNKEQSNIWVVDSAYRFVPKVGYTKYYCPGCDAELPDSIVQESDEY